MGKNAALVLLAVALAVFVLWAISSSDSKSGQALHEKSNTALKSKELRSRDLKLPESGEAVILPASHGAEEVRQEVIATDPVIGLVDLDLLITTFNGDPLAGAKLRLHLSNGKILTRWSSQRGDLTLYSIPVGKFWVSSPGYRIAFPHVDEPTTITNSGVLKVQVAGSHEVRGSIYSDTTDEGEIRLYRSGPGDRAFPRQITEEEASRQLAKMELFDRLKGPTRLPPMGQRPFDHRTFSQVPEGELITSLTKRSFPGDFEFKGLDPGGYQLVVDSRQHTKRILNFEVLSPITLLELDISDGYQILVATQFRSGKLPRRNMVRLLDQFGTDLPRRTLESSEDSHSGRWTFSDLEAGTWFVEVRPGTGAIGRQYPVEVPTHTPSVPVLDLVLEEPRETTIQVKFNSSQAIVLDKQDLLIAVFRLPSGQFLGSRSVRYEGLKPAASGEIVELHVGPLFPGEYDVFLYPDPSAASFRVLHVEGQAPRYISDFSADWVGPFEAKKVPLSLGVGSEPATVEVSLSWYRPPSEKPLDPAELLLRDRQ
ncbi:MAG: hypothetical protein ACJAVJ_000693 [Planctomycetota bacterium]|jgi:hypothetical protein